jgi:hypothetical protein
MFDFFGRLARANLHITDLQFCTPDGFRKFADRLCAQAGGGWKRKTVKVNVPGFPHLKARPPAR